MTNETLPLAYDEVMQQTYNQPQPIFHKNHETGKEDFTLCRCYNFQMMYLNMHLCMNY